MITYLTTYFEDDDVTYWWEVAPDGWITRTIEEVGGVLVSAASLPEVVAARDDGGLAGVREYEARYGIAPDRPISDCSFPHTAISEAEFERRWSAARADLEAGPPHSS